MKFNCPYPVLSYPLEQKKSLTDLKISTLNQLKDLAAEKLNSVENVGVKRVNEILSWEEEMEIKIV